MQPCCDDPGCPDWCDDVYGNKCEGDGMEPCCDDPGCPDWCDDVYGNKCEEYPLDCGGCGECRATWCDVPDDDARLNEEGGPGTCASWTDEDWCDHPEDGSGMRMWFRGVCAATCCERGGHGGESG